MNSFLSISFALLFLLKGMMPGMDLSCEFQKLPNLLAHYQEHKATNKDSFYEFITNHYFGDLAQGHEDAEHDKLPFHGNHNCWHPTFFYANEQHFALNFDIFNTPVDFEFYKTLFSSPFPDSPFQPPQV